MTELVRFEALAFHFTGSGLVAGEPIECASPLAAIQTAQGQWKHLGHAGAIAFSRTTDFEKGRFSERHVLRRFGQVLDEYARDQPDA
jgi:hypothetical protein